MRASGGFLRRRAKGATAVPAAILKSRFAVTGAAPPATRSGHGPTRIAAQTTPPHNPDKTREPRVDTGLVKGNSPEIMRKVRPFPAPHNSLTDRSMNCRIGLK
jgi:hypothetical protein